ncbi:MAG: hypothetical protein ACKOAR_13900, partial [Bacteroidota bacterium]
IMTYAIGFPKYYSPVQKDINHDEIIALKPISKISSRSKAPQPYAGQTAGATIFLLGAMIAGVVLLF